MVFHTNVAESYHSLLKRGVAGAFHHVNEKHLGSYLAEFDRRWDTPDERDGMCAVDVTKTAIGARLTFNNTVG